MQKKVVILGGVGLIGTHLCKKILDRGDRVYCVDTRELSSSPLLRELEQHADLHYVRHNVVAPFTIRCDEIYNLCSPIRLNYDKQLPVEGLKTYLQGSFNTLENARTEFARVVHASSSAVYNPNPRLEFDLRNEQCTSAEGIRAAEMIHHAYFHEYGVDSRIARIFNVYGTGADPNDRRVVMRMITSALQNRDLTIFGNGEQLRTFCWVEDAADGLLALMEASPCATPRIVDLGGDTEITVRALAEKIIELTGSRSRINHVEARIGEVRSRRPNLAAAQKELGWKPRTALAEGLQRTIEYTEKMLSAYAGANRSWIEIYG